MTETYQLTRNILPFSFHLALPLTAQGRVLRAAHHRPRNSSKAHFCGILTLLCSGPCSQANHGHKQLQSFFYPGAAFRFHHNSQVSSAHFPSLSLLCPVQSPNTDARRSMLATHLSRGLQTAHGSRISCRADFKKKPIKPKADP